MHDSNPYQNRAHHNNILQVITHWRAANWCTVTAPNISTVFFVLEKRIQKCTKIAKIEMITAECLMRYYEQATVRDLFSRAAQVDQLLSPSCKRSFCSVLSLALRARWFPDGPGKVFALGYCRPASLCLFQLRERSRCWVCVSVCVWERDREKESERLYITWRHGTDSPIFLATQIHTIANRVFKHQAVWIWSLILNCCACKWFYGQKSKGSQDYKI